MDTRRALTVVPVVVLLAVRKELATPDDVVQLADGFLRVVASAAVHVSVEDAAGDQLSLVPAGSRPSLRSNSSTHGYPSTRSRIKA